MAPILKAVAGEDYLANGLSISGETAWELYSGYALQWMRQSPEWMAALGFKLHKSYPYQSGDGTTAGTNDQRGFGTGFIDEDYFARWDEFDPVFEPTKPDPATRQMFTLTGTKKGFEFRLDDIPHDGWSRLTDIEIRIGNGDWLSTGITQYRGELRLRYQGRRLSRRDAGVERLRRRPGERNEAGRGGQGIEAAFRGLRLLGRRFRRRLLERRVVRGKGRDPFGTDRYPGSRVVTASPSRITRVAGPASARLITAPTRLSVEFLRTVTPVPVPPSLPLMLGALGALAVASRYRAPRLLTGAPERQRQSCPPACSGQVRSAGRPPAGRPWPACR